MRLEIFSCAGGMAEGFRRASLPFDVAIDKDPDACDSYETNLGHRPHQVDVQTHGLNGIVDRPVDLLVADPPCTPWSMSGARQGLDDPRDCLVVTVELVRELRPRVWMIANVPGLDTKPNWHVVQETIGSLDRYVIKYASLNAADYGVPQVRIRPFWVGLPAELAQRFRWPEPTHCDPRRGGHLFGKPAWVTCRQALGHLCREDLGRPVKLAWKPTTPHRPGTIVAGAGKGATTMVSDQWPWDRPSTVVQCDDRLGAPGHHDPAESNSQHREAIVLSERARLILQGFPGDWVVCGKTKKSRDSQIGQAMPPPLAEVVARQIAEVIA